MALGVPRPQLFQTDALLSTTPGAALSTRLPPRTQLLSKAHQPVAWGAAWPSASGHTHARLSLACMGHRTWLARLYTHRLVLLHALIILSWCPLLLFILG